MSVGATRREVNEPWAMVPLSLIATPGITMSDIRLYAYLDNMGGKRHWWYGPQAEITAGTGLPERTIRDSLARLVDAEYIGVERMGVDKGTVNKYLILARTVALAEEATGEDSPVATGSGSPEVRRISAGRTSSSLQRSTTEITNTARAELAIADGARRTAVKRALFALHDRETNAKITLTEETTVIDVYADSLELADVERAATEFGEGMGWPIIVTVLGRVSKNRERGVEDPWAFPRRTSDGQGRVRGDQGRDGRGDGGPASAGAGSHRGSARGGGLSGGPAGAGAQPRTGDGHLVIEPTAITMEEIERRRLARAAQPT